MAEVQVVIENRLDCGVYVTAVRRDELQTTFIVSSEKRLVLVGEVLQQENLFPGTALSLKGFNERTKFAVAFEGFKDWRLAADVGPDSEKPDECFRVILLFRERLSV